VSDDEIARIGRGLVALTGKVGRLAALVESMAQPASATGSSERGVLHALLDAIDALHAAAEAAPPDVGEGLRVAAGRAEAALRAEGLSPVPTAGPFDPSRHHAIARAPAPNAALVGTIARVHAAGWARGDALVRPALVTVYADPEEQA
jgi:molecular chaperone GrpE (heat shock protein)